MGMSNEEVMAAAARLKRAESAYDWLCSSARRQKKADGCDTLLHAATMRDISSAMIQALLELIEARSSHLKASRPKEM